MKDLLFRNMSLKILSFFFAVSLWLFVNLKSTAESTLQIPVRWENLPSFLIITNVVNDSVRVRVAGPRRILAHFDPSRLPVPLDLSDAKHGLSNYQINEKMIPLPPGLTATVLPPDTIQFKFELTLTKDVEVRPRTRGKPAEGYVVEDTKAVPSRVEIVGAQGELQGISQVDTEAVDVTDRKQDFSARARIHLPQSHAWPATGQGEVEVRVVLAEKTIQRLLKQISLTVENAEGPVRLEPPGVDILLEGPAGKIHSLEAHQVAASVVLPEEGLPAEGLPVRIQLPVDGIRATSHPEKVAVKHLAPEDTP